MEKTTILEKLESFNEQLNLTHYWIAFLKYKKLLLLIPIFAALLGYMIALNIKPIFQSNATLIIEDKDRNIVNIEEVYVAETPKGLGGYNHINNQLQILKSSEVINGILSNEKITKKIRYLHSSIPEQYFTRNMNVR